MLVPALSLHNRFSQLIAFAVGIILIIYFFTPASFEVRQHLYKSPSRPASHPKVNLEPQVLAKPRTNHPIDHLIQRAQSGFQAVLAKETKTVSEAAEAYRVRRGRQPPPWFDKWFAYASEHSAVVVEDFWDTIYDNLNPFWGVPAKQIREQAHGFLFRIAIRNGTTSYTSDGGDRPWLGLWQEMIQSVAPHLPDLDVAVNVMDESRIVVPFEELSQYVSRGQSSKNIVPEGRLKKQFANITKELDAHPLIKYDPVWDSEGPYWQHAVVGCPPESPARNVYIETDFTSPPNWVTSWPKGSYEGYVQNMTFARSPCDHAELQGLHGSFIEPVSISNTKTLFPLFGGSKLPMNNEILIPPAMYYTDDPFYSGGQSTGGAWAEKSDRLIWRGVASGGRNRVENWTRFQRHRFVSMMNATNVENVLTNATDAPANFVLPAHDAYNLAVDEPGTRETALSDWMETWSDAAFINLECFPRADGFHCPYTDPYFTVLKLTPMEEQYNIKYLPDIDGNSFSGRYRGFLRSTSLPIKSTIYEEWHDSRLVPWVHFVPMDHTFIDIYGIMEYFLGNKAMALEGHDAAAEKIATDGSEWAARVLRKEDMSIYVFRLLLEYARLCEDDRDILGWAEPGDV